MVIDQLRAAGAFVSLEPVKVPLAWNGQDFAVYIRRLSFGDVEAMAANGNSASALIAKTVLLGEEKQPMTLADAESLSTPLAVALLAAINSVNGTNGDAEVAAKN